jgi:hypothetical protein
VSFQPTYSGVLPDGLWLGGNDLAVEGRWIWESSKEMMTFTNWGNYSGFSEFSSFQPGKAISALANLGHGCTD